MFWDITPDSSFLKEASGFMLLLMVVVVCVYVCFVCVSVCLCAYVSLWAKGLGTGERGPCKSRKNA